MKNELRRYWPNVPTPATTIQHIEKLVGQVNGPWEPLIAFPHEKHREIERPTAFGWGPYLRTVEKHAADVLTSATEVRIIGYSFAAIDSRHVVENLLSKIPANARITVQNPDLVTVRPRVEVYESFKGRVEFDPTPF